MADKEILESSAQLPCGIQGEEDDLEANPAQRQQQRRKKEPRSPTISQHWNQTIDTTHADYICILLCFITGLCDSSAYNAWSCFLAMQTGNTIFLALGASNQPPTKPWGWLKSLISITSFFMGAFTFAHTTYHFQPKKRGTLIISFLCQTILIVIAVSLIQANLIPHTAEDTSLTGGRLFLELIPIALLAFQSAGSIASSRALGYTEIPTVVLTSVYFDIASDPNLTAGVLKRGSTNAKRNRRVGGVVGLLVGAIVGGWLSRSSGGMQSALWVAGGLKFCLGVLWWFWRPARQVE